jgi:hypothetical protein
MIASIASTLARGRTQGERGRPPLAGDGQQSAATTWPALVGEQRVQALRPAVAVLGERVPQAGAVAQVLDLIGRQPGLGQHLLRQQPGKPGRVEPVGLRTPLRAGQVARLARIAEAYLDAACLQLARDPAPAGGRLERDRLQPALPARRPVVERLARGRQPLLAELAAVGVQHGRLEDPLVDVDRCIDHLVWASFVDSDLTRPRSYRGRGRPHP